MAAADFIYFVVLDINKPVQWNQDFACKFSMFFATFFYFSLAEARGACDLSGIGISDSVKRGLDTGT